jgi:hypothetical protein
MQLQRLCHTVPTLCGRKDIVSELTDALEKLSVGPDDIVILRNADRFQVQDFIASCQKIGWRYHNPLLMLHGDQDISTISRARMRALGFIHEDEIEANNHQVQNPHGDEG